MRRRHRCTRTSLICVRCAFRPRSAARAGTDERGFALVIVLWFLVLIAFLVAHMTALGRTEIHIVRNIATNAETRAAADGAVFEAIFYLLHPDVEQRWAADRSSHEIEIGTARVAVRIEDEAGRINPSFAPPKLVKALLEVLGTDAEAAGRLSEAIADWVGTAPVARPAAAALADYRAVGLDYGPPGEPLESDEELGRVVGMTPGLLASMRPHLTAFGPAQPKRSAADPVVAAALDRFEQSGAAKTPRTDNPEMLTARISATAFGPGNATVSRMAVVRVDRSLPWGYAMLFWGTPRD